MQPVERLNAWRKRKYFSFLNKRKGRKKREKNHKILVSYSLWCVFFFLLFFSHFFLYFICLVSTQCRSMSCIIIINAFKCSTFAIVNSKIMIEWVRVIYRKHRVPNEQTLFTVAFSPHFSFAPIFLNFFSIFIFFLFISLLLHFYFLSFIHIFFFFIFFFCYVLVLEFIRTFLVHEKIPRTKLFRGKTLYTLHN